MLNVETTLPERTVTMHRYLLSLDQFKLERIYDGLKFITFTLTNAFACFMIYAEQVFRTLCYFV